jgi:hypothetical protein
LLRDDQSQTRTTVSALNSGLDSNHFSH